MRFLFRSIKWLFSSVWRLINFTRLLVLNLIFLSFILLVIFAFNQEKPTTEIHDGALVLDLSGSLVEQLDQTSSANQLISQLLSDDDTPKETQISDIVYVLRHATTDARVKGVVLKTAGLETTNITKLAPIARALDAFRQSKKPVVAVGDFYQQHQYYLAAHADTILLNPAGAVAIQGLSTYNLYFKSALDKFNIEPHIFRVGTYKSFVEPYIRDEMSPEAKENNQRWLNQMWKNYVENVSATRNIEPDVVTPTKTQLLARLQKAEGNAAQYALDTGLVDQLATSDDIIDTVSQFAGKNASQDFNAISFRDYLSVLPSPTEEKPTQPRVALLVASGTIADGTNQENMINGEKLAKQIRKLALDPKIKALVLRIDSPGGSAFAAEEIRTALLSFKETGKPYVVSMGSVAASGGYWIAADADRIYAEPTTITGSIGVFGMFMTADKALNSLGVHVDGFGTTDFTGISPLQPLPEHIKQIIQMNVENTYQRFIDLVSEGRGLTPEQVDNIAQGRVWIGTDAKANGLVDELGDVKAAADNAALLAKLTDYQLITVEPELSAKQKLINELFSDSSALLPESVTHSLLGKILMTSYTQAETALKPWQNLNDPQGIYAFCPACQL